MATIKILAVDTFYPSSRAETSEWMITKQCNVLTKVFMEFIGMSN